GAGEGEHLVGDGAAAHELVLVLDRGGPRARGDGVLGGDGAGGDHVGEGGALPAVLPSSEVGPLPGVGGAGGKADQGQRGGCGDDGATPGAEAGGGHGSLRSLGSLRVERAGRWVGGDALSARGSWTGTRGRV